MDYVFVRGDLSGLMGSGGDTLADAAAFEREADDHVTAVTVGLLGEP